MKGLTSGTAAAVLWTTLGTCCVTGNVADAAAANESKALVRRFF